MKSEAMCIAVAEILGWRFSGHPAADAIMRGWKFAEQFCIHPETGEPLSINANLPHFDSSLDAMHEAEKTITDEQEYRNCIGYLVSTLKPGEFAVRATALQRCEAFLRVHGKYVEDGK